MHNCSKTREQIIELLLDDTNQSRDLLVADLHACRDCTAEFDTLNATLRITSRLKETGAPSESYWTGYHAKLRGKIVCAVDGQRRAGPEGPPLRSMFRALFRSSIRVPVPVAAAAVIVCLVLVSVSLRKSDQPAAQSPAVVQVPVEVPVVQEKIVTRVVYKERRQRSKNPTRATSNRTVEDTFAKSQKIEPSLSGFKPAGDIKLTVIKGGFANEK